MRAKISIVTPSYNQGQFIEEAIQSVLNQNYPNFEHIIIDGESTDKTIEVLKKYPHLKWISEPDEGQSDAINKGFRRATGDIIGWLNADDYYLPGVFEKVNENLSDTSVDALYANYKFVDENCNITREMVTHRPVQWLSLFQCFIPSTTFFLKRSIIDNGIYIDKGFQIAMDKEFFAHILTEGFELIHIDDFFAHFRWHGNNKSIDTKEVKKIRLEEGIKIFNRYSKYNITSKRFYNLIIHLSSLYKKYLRTF